MEYKTCPLCNVDYDENGVCAVTCMALVTAEDDQERAAAYETLKDGVPEITEQDRELVALILFNIRSRQTYRH